MDVINGECEQVSREISVRAFRRGTYIEIALHCPRCGADRHPESSDPEESVKLLVWVVEHECEPRSVRL